MPQTLTRRELYELVWSRPMTQLAQEFGLSGVGLKKICDRHRVPTPRRGYWAKKEAGKRVKQTILVEVDEEHLNRIKISASGARLPEEVAAVLKRQRTEKVQTARKPRVEQPAATDPFAISDLHATIRQTAKALRRPTKDAVSVRAFGDGLCGVEVGIASAERAIVILHRLASRLELKGLPLTPVGDGIRLARGADEAKFHIREVTKTVPHTPTEAELAAEQQRLRRRELYWQDPDRWSPPSYQRAYPETDRLWTGRLFLEIEGYSDGVRRRWSDGKTQTVESLLDSIVDGFEVLLAARKIAREKREEWHRQWAELDRRRGLARERRKREELRATTIDELVELSDRAAKLRAFLARIGGENASEDDVVRMMEWANDRLRRMEERLTVGSMGKVLIDRKLFPAPGADELRDPLGDPPHHQW